MKKSANQTTRTHAKHIPVLDLGLNPDLKQLKTMVKQIKIAMLTTMDEDGVLHSRPMMAPEIEGQGELWFFTLLHSGAADEIKNGEQVNLSYASLGYSQYVSIAGKAEIVYNLNKANELWKPGYRVWFPKGLEDPALVLVKVKIADAQYWNHAKGTMVKLWGFARAVLSGESYKVRENKKIKLHH